MGLPESFTPAKSKFRTRVFPALEKGRFEPYKIRELPQKSKPTTENGGDVEMGGTTEEDAAKVDEDEDLQFEEDMESDEGAIYPLSREFRTHYDHK